MAIYELSHQNSSLEIVSFGCHITKWGSILYQGSEKKRTGIPILFPYFGKSLNGRQHGFGREVKWKLEDQSPDTISLSLDSSSLNETYQSEYPYHFQAQITISLFHSSFIFNLIIKNTSDKKIPISPGLHPYFSLPHSQKKLITTNIPGFNPQIIDWDNLPPNTRYLYIAKCLIDFPSYQLSIEDISPKSVIKYIGVWSQTPETPDFDFICFEPVCGEEGDYDTSPILVEPGTSWQMKVKFSVNQ